MAEVFDHIQIQKHRNKGRQGQRNRDISQKSTLEVFSAPARRQSEATQTKPRWRTNKNMELDEENIEDQKPRAPCSGLRKELKECILESDCVKKVKFK